MNLEVILTIAFFIILISIQFTLNLILKELRIIKKIVIKDKETENLEKARKWEKQADV